MVPITTPGPGKIPPILFAAAGEIFPVTIRLLLIVPELAVKVLISSYRNNYISNINLKIKKANNR